MNFKTYIAKNYVNFRGWSTKRKIVVIESDDWGSIRMPSKKVYDALEAQGIPVGKSYFTKYDSLESQEDLEQLFAVLRSFTDKNGNYPSITANAVVANPNFEAIRDSNFSSYHYEKIEETYLRYYGNTNVFDTWKEGIAGRLLYPQFHGREHIGVWEWMNAIRSGETQEQQGFEHQAILGLGNRKSATRQKDYTAAFDYVTDEEKLSLLPILEDGLQLFEQTFGFKSKSFIAPSAIRGDYLDECLFKNGVSYHQLGQQLEPNGKGGLHLKDRFWGDKNEFGQLYWRRNATFEPSRNPDFDWVNSCMKEMAIAFRWGKPAVINSHRVNFMGSLSEENRRNSLYLLDLLLKSMLQKWPDIEFLSSDELGDYMAATLL
ncbi:polysaccharide (de)acetylase [Flavobacterium sp. RSB2_4_14]|uniref:polysaccharide (de)acetylase n=1 Tax=Flavobacterium sp. RSB2_4_14 TaxID=3447665 RepID=UPI003F3DACBF